MVAPPSIITPLCVFTFGPDRRAVLSSVHPGATIDEVVERTGFTFEISDTCGETPGPTPRELEIAEDADRPQRGLAVNAQTVPGRLLELAEQGRCVAPAQASGRLLSREQVIQRASGVAAQLHDHGVTAGDPVVIMLPNSEEFVLSWFGVALAGAGASAGQPG